MGKKEEQRSKRKRLESGGEEVGEKEKEKKGGGKVGRQEHREWGQ